MRSDTKHMQGILEAYGYARILPELNELWKLGDPSVLDVWELTNNVGRVEVTLKRDWNLHDTIQKQEEIISKSKKAFNNLDKIRKDWQETFRGYVTKDYKPSDILKEVKRFSDTEVYEIMQEIKKMFIENESFFKAKSKAAQNRLADLVMDIEGGIMSVLKSLKKIEGGKHRD